MRRFHVRGALLALMALGLPSCGEAALVQANPANLAAKLAAARPGDTVKLAPGEYRTFVLSGRRFSPELVIDATGAKVVEAKLANTQGVTIRGGSFLLGPPTKNPKTGGDAFGAAIRMNNVEKIRILDARFVGPSAVTGPLRREFGEGYGVRVLGGRGVDVVNGQFEGFKNGMAMTRIDGFKLAGNVFTGMRSDGLSVSLSRNGVIENNECKSTRVRDKEHPDCIQMWSRPIAPPTSDVIIRGNRIEGSTQGIGLHNHVRKGVDDGGFDRITIEDNIVRVSRPNAISLQGGRASTVRNNKVSTFPGAKYRASIRTSGDSVTMCGNVVEAGAGKPAVKERPC